MMPASIRLGFIPIPPVERPAGPSRDVFFRETPRGRSSGLLPAGADRMWSRHPRRGDQGKCDDTWDPFGEKLVALVQAQIPARDDSGPASEFADVPGQVGFLEDLSQVPGSDGSVQAASVNPTIFNSQSSDRARRGRGGRRLVVATELPDHDLTVFAGRDQASFPFGSGA